MDANKRQRYEKIAEELTRLAGGRENLQGIAHCATRLRLVLSDNNKADLKAMEDVDLAKGVFVAGDQVQIIFGAGLVNDVYEVIADYNNMKNMSLSDLKTVANQKMNPLQRIIKALSDVFVDIMPGILAAALLTGLSGVLGNLEFVQNIETLYGINRLINIASGAIFGFLPLAVAYSACKRFGGRPILGIVMGCIMLSNSLADAYAAAQGTVEVTTLHIFGLPVALVGFQGGIIVALLMGWLTARLDKFFEKKVPEVIRLLVSPLLTTLVGALLLFTIVGPLGRGLSSGLTSALVWMTQNLGVIGYAVFSGLQQLVVITGLHHIFGAIEAQLLADTGRNFLNPLMSVAIIAQGGAVLGYMLRHKDNLKVREMCVPSFISVLFGITEPAIFGVNLRYRYPLIGGCIGGALGGVVVYLTNLAALGFGTTVLPGIALADPANNGYVSYIIAHVVAISGGFILTLVLSGFMEKAPADGAAQSQNSAPKVDIPSIQCQPGTVYAPVSGTAIPSEEIPDQTFAAGVLGRGVGIQPTVGLVVAPFDGEISSVTDTRHAVGIASPDGMELLIHVGVDTVAMQGDGFQCFVQEGQKVKAGDKLIAFDRAKIAAAKHPDVVVVLVTNSDDYENLTIQTGPCNVLDQVITV